MLPTVLAQITPSAAIETGSAVTGTLWALSSAGSVVLVIAAIAIYDWYRRCLRVVSKDIVDVADLAAKKTQLESEVQQAIDWLQVNKDELLRLEAERQQQEVVRQELATLLGQTAELRQKCDDYQQELNSKQSILNILSTDAERLELQKTTLEANIAESTQKAKIAEEEKTIANAETETVKRSLDEFKKTLEADRTRLLDLAKNISEYEIKQQNLIGETNVREARLTDLKSQLQVIEERLARAKSDIEPLEELLKKKQEVREERDDLLRESNELKASIVSLKRERNILNEELKALGASETTEDETNRRYSDLLDVEPKCLDAALFPRGTSNVVNENDALNRLQQHLAQCNLTFPKRTLLAFHTSLKVQRMNPLTVLAGVSGTGKTELPIRYAEAMGMHNLVLSVQPRWDSPQDMFGFYNYLEHKYKATDLARALIRMDPYNFASLNGKKRSDSVLLVLLDEMNLARVEYYFSEFLSKLEIRRGIADSSSAEQRARAEFELETGPRRDFRLWVGSNVLFVGTMNEDESTQTLSDKVLDRANVLRFGRPTERTQPMNTGTSVGLKCDSSIHIDSWESWIKKPEQSVNQPWSGKVNTWTETINDALSRIGRPFGHRVIQSIQEYVANYPDGDYGDNFKAAFADQVEQKVLPKLRGIDLFETNSKIALNEVQGVIEELKDDELTETFNICKSEESSTFMWRGVSRRIL